MVPGFGVQTREVTPVGKGFRRKPKDADDRLLTLLTNLGTSKRTVQRIGSEALLREFILHHHLNIDWYERHIAEEQKKQRRFFWGSVALLILIPILTLAISYGTSSPTLVAAQLTAVLTGIIGFQSALRSLFEKRDVVTLFHKASSALKKATYEFEDRWAGCVPNASSSNEEIESFKANLRQMIRKARDIQSEEQETYFASRAGYPLLDLRTLLSDSGSAAAEVVGRYMWKRPSQVDRPASGAHPVQVFGVRVTVLRAKLTALNAAFARTQDHAQRQVIRQEIAVTESQLEEAEEALLHVEVRQFDAIP
jgi:hypothetical protein